MLKIYIFDQYIQAISRGRIQLGLETFLIKVLIEDNGYSIVEISIAVKNVSKAAY